MLKVRLAAFTDTVTGDIKPRNIVRFGEAIKLIDLDASVRLCAGAKFFHWYGFRPAQYDLDAFFG